MRFALAFVLIAAPAAAQQDAMSFAVDAGNLLGADEACGIGFDPVAVDTFVKANTDPEDLSAARLLDMMISGTRMQLAEMKPSDLAIQCELARRSAEALGLIAK